MQTETIARIDGGSAEYWRQRRLAFDLIRAAECAEKRAASAPMYLHGGYDEDGDVIPVENLQPYEDLEIALQAVLADPTAMRILVAQHRRVFCGHPIG